ncbi:NAD(+) diphosphatase [Treponema sp. HNW]|uniref:NAD(+) diphosphatase n=1 Tax=Treponema sp. HNW TaxID=3116654 RepID=UPI003D0C64D7
MALISNPAQAAGKRIFLFSENKLLVCAGTQNELPGVELFERCMQHQFICDWLYDTDYEYTAALLEKDVPIGDGFCRIPLRSIFAAEEAFAFEASRAHALLNWKAGTRFCSYCGNALKDAEDETARTCVQCTRRVYPSLSPAIIVLVEKEGKLLLAKHSRRNTDVYTCLAGYVEAGENLENCVAREIKEETGIEVTNIRYVTSQSWPFPDQLMAGFRADWKSGEINIQQSEISDARWFSKDALPEIPKPGSLAYKLITGALSE